MTKEATQSEKRLFFEADVRKHQQYLMVSIVRCVNIMLKRGTRHDASKLTPHEFDDYVEPVWALNHEEVPYGSERYNALTEAMGLGWQHHKAVNDHHPKDVKDMSLFSLLEMVCDWVAASQRRNNGPLDALTHLDFPEVIESILKNTIDELCRDNGE